MHQTYNRTIDGNIICGSYALKVIERQANVCAAAFLMPAELIRKIYKKRLDNNYFARFDYMSMKNLIRNMAVDFNVSKQAMSYRLQNLGLIDEYEENLL